MTKHPQFVVTITQLEHATVADVRAYIEDAVGSWCGSLRPPGVFDEADPGDPLWRIVKTVKVARLRRLSDKP